jgi:hypothetical protein
VTERRSKLPPLVVDGVDINECGHRVVEQALVEIGAMKTSTKRFKAAVDVLFTCRDAGAQLLPADLLDQISTAMSEFLVEMTSQGGSS